MNIHPNIINLSQMMSCQDAVLGNRVTIAMLQADLSELDKNSPKRAEIQEKIDDARQSNRVLFAGLKEEICTLDRLGERIEDIKGRFPDYQKQLDELNLQRLEKPTLSYEERYKQHHVAEHRFDRNLDFGKDR